MGTPITSRPINVYTCVNCAAARPIALIEGVDMIFRAPTPMAARAAAQEWAREAVRTTKHLTKQQKADILEESQ